MELKTFLQQLSDGNYRKRKSIIKNHLLSFFQESADIQRLVICALEHKKSFLIPEFWEVVAGLNTNDFEGDIQNWIQRARLFFVYHEKLTEHVKNLEKLLFEGSEEPVSVASLFVSFGKAVEIGGTNHYSEFRQVLQTDNRHFLQTQFLHGYNFHSLKCLNRIISRNIRKTRLSKIDTDLSNPGYDKLLVLDRLICYEQNLDILEGMMDAWIYADFQVEVLMEDNKVEKVLLQPLTDSELTRVRSQQLKDIYRNLHYEHHSVDVVSSDPHIAIMAKKFKTDKGMIGIITSNIPVTDMTRGLVPIEAPELFEKKDGHDLSPDQLLLFYYESLLHYKYRRFREKSTFPSDTEDIENTEISLKQGRKVSLMAIFKVVDAISSFSELYRSLQSDDLLRKKLRVVDSSIQNKKIDRLTSQSLEELDIAICISPISIEDYHCKQTIRGLVHLIKMLTNLPVDQIFSALRILAISAKNEVEFQVVLFHKSNAYWKWQPFIERSISKFLYDQYFLEKIYVKENNHKKRATAYEERLANYFRFAGFSATYNFPYGDQQGEADVIAIKDDYIFLIEIKLSNKNRISFRDQNSWRHSNIDESALKQVKRSVDFFSTKKGQELLRDEMNIESSIPLLKVVPLIVLDNFFYDHQAFVYDDKLQKRVQAVSFFELYLLLNNRSLLNPDHLPEFSFQPTWFRGNSIPKPVTLEPDESGKISALLHSNGEVEKNIEPPEIMSPNPAKTPDERKFRKWWDHENGISPACLLNLVENNDVWSFLHEELSGFRNQIGLSASLIEFRYDI